jgi:hypothetical protein
MPENNKDKNGDFKFQPGDLVYYKNKYFIPFKVNRDTLYLVLRVYERSYHTNDVRCDLYDFKGSCVCENFCADNFERVNGHE